MQSNSRDRTAIRFAAWEGGRHREARQSARLHPVLPIRSSARRRPTSIRATAEAGPPAITVPGAARGAPCSTGSGMARPMRRGTSPRMAALLSALRGDADRFGMTRCPGRSGAREARSCGTGGPRAGERPARATEHSPMKSTSHIWVRTPRPHADQRRAHRPAPRDRRPPSGPAGCEQPDAVLGRGARRRSEAAEVVEVRHHTRALWKRHREIPAGREGAKDLVRVQVCRRWPSMAGRFSAAGSAEAASTAVAGMARRAQAR